LVEGQEEGGMQEREVGTGFAMEDISRKETYTTSGIEMCDKSGEGELWTTLARSMTATSQNFGVLAKPGFGSRRPRGDLNEMTGLSS
jgi:hypothetical protein